MADHAVVANQYSSSYVGTLSDLGVGPNIGGTFDDRARLYLGTWADEDLFTEQLRILHKFPLALWHIKLIHVVTEQS